MDSYKIGIAILLTDGFSTVLSKLSHQLVGVHGSVKEIEKGFGRWGLAIGGVGAVLAGSALLGGMAKLVDKTKEYSDELVKLERLGGGIAAAAVSGDIGKRAFDIAQRVPMKVTDLLKIPGATYSILGQEESMKLWEPLARFSWVMQSQNGYAGDPGSDLQKILRAGELSGRLTDPATHQVSVAQTERFLDLAARVMAATHGMVNPDTLLGMAKQGGFTLRGLSDQGFYTQAIMAQAMGGPRAGTAFLSLWQQMAAGTMFTRTLLATASNDVSRFVILLFFSLHHVTLLDAVLDIYAYVGGWRLLGGAVTLLEIGLSERRHTGMRFQKVADR
jgi:hypothetical protein